MYKSYLLTHTSTSIKYYDERLRCLVGVLHTALKNAKRYQA